MHKPDHRCMAALVLPIILCMIGVSPAQAGPDAPPPEPRVDPSAQATTMSPVTGTTPVDGSDERMRLVSQMLAELPFQSRFELRRYIDPSRWLFGVRSGLTPDRSNPSAPSRFRFRCFITPEVDNPDSPRENPFALDETLRRGWRHASFRCVGELPGSRLVFEANRSSGNAPESWFVVFWFARSRSGRQAITRIDDARTLRFCLVEDRKPEPDPDAAPDAPPPPPVEWLLLTPFAAHDACVAGVVPRRSTPRLRRETFKPMSLSDPLMPPYLLIETIDLERSRLLVGSRYGDGIAVGERFLCYSQRPYRLVGLDDHRAVFENWAGYRFVLDKRTQTLEPPDPDFQRLGGDSDR